MVMEQIQGKVKRLDALAALVRLDCGPEGFGYTHQKSSRKRKLDDDASSSWSDGTADDETFFNEFRARARGYCGNRMSKSNAHPRHERTSRRAVISNTSYQCLIFLALLFLNLKERLFEICSKFSSRLIILCLFFFARK